MNLDNIKVCVNVVPYPHEEINKLKGELEVTQENLFHEREENEELTECVEFYKAKYEALLKSHAEVLEKQQYFEGKEKFYNTLLKPSVNIKDFLDRLNEQDELLGNNTLIFCTNDYQVSALKDLINNYENATVNLRASYVLANGATLFIKVVTNLEEAYTRYSGLVGNNVLVHSFMKSDVELCRWAFSRARYTTKGYQPEFIVYDF